jgi:hypothetical protein
MFSELLDERERSRATAVVRKVAAHGLPMALTGGLAIEMQLRANGRYWRGRPLNDLDFVIAGFEAIPPSLAGDFLLNHVHPNAPEGKTLLQLIDVDRAVRVDLFRAFGKTLSRTSPLETGVGPFDLLAVEDLATRATAQVCAALSRGRTLAPKHAATFRRLMGFGRRRVLLEAWEDHREGLPVSFDDAVREASRLLDDHPELLVEDGYSQVVTHCERCQSSGPFRPSSPELIVRTLGYW